MPGKNYNTDYGKSVLKKRSGFKMAGMEFGNEDPSIYAYKKARDPRKAGPSRGGRAAMMKKSKYHKK